MCTFMIIRLLIIYILRQWFCYFVPEIVQKFYYPSNTKPFSAQILAGPTKQKTEPNLLHMQRKLKILIIGDGNEMLHEENQPVPS